MELLSLEQVVTRHKLCSEILHPIDDLGPDWPATVRAQHAGETAEMFVPEYIPFAEDGAGDFLYVDTREGEQQGCIRYFAAEAADEGGPLFGSLTEYGDSVRRSVESGSEHSYLVPSVTEGCWRGMSTFPIDLRWLRSRIRRRCIFCSRSVTFSPRKSPSMTTLSTSMSFARLSSNTARSLHPGAEVQGGEVVFRRVPRQRGVTVNSVVQVDGEPKNAPTNSSLRRPKSTTLTFSLKKSEPPTGKCLVDGGHFRL